MKNKMQKRLIATLLALCLALALLPGTALAAEDSGTCGDNATWEYSDGTLTIQGTGSMVDYMVLDYNDAPPPWNHYKEKIHTVIIGNGVTSIGDNAFGYCWRLTNVTIPDSVTSIGERAFWNCNSLVQQRINNQVMLHSQRNPLVSPFKGFRREVKLFNKASDTCN